MIKIVHLVFWLIIAPLFLAFAVCVLVTLQSPSSWKDIMPSIINPHPSLGQNYTFITSENSYSIPWDITSYIPSSYPEDNNIWFILKENAKISIDSNSGVGRFYAVDEDGNFFYISSCRQINDTLSRCLDNDTIPWELVDTATKTKLLQQLQSSTVLVESDEIWESIKYRIGNSAQSVNPITFANFFSYYIATEPRKFPDIIIWLRLAILFGIIVNGSLLAWHITSNLTKYWRLCVTIISGYLSFLIILPITVLFSVILIDIFSWLPVFLWILSISLYLFSIRHVKRFTITYINFQKLISHVITTGLILGTVILTFLPRYLNSLLTMGDNLRYIYGSMFVYNYGYWPVDLVAKQIGQTALLTHYPPGPSIFLSLWLWVFHISKDQMYFPGIDTTQLLTSYAIFSVFLQIIFVSSVALAIKALTPNRLWWLIAIWLLYSIIPSVHGTPSAADTILWPLFGLLMILGILWYKTQHNIFWYLFSMLVSIILISKQEGLLLIVLFFAPFLLLTFAEKKLLPLKKLFLSIGLAAIPYAIWLIQKNYLGVHSVVYAPINLYQIIIHFELYYNIVLRNISFISYEDRAGWLLMLSMPIVLMYKKPFGIKGMLAHTYIIIPIIIYIFGMSLTYLFSTEPNISTMISVSWSRLLIYPALYSASVALLIITQSEK